MYCLQNSSAGFKGLKTVSIRHMDLRAAAEFPGVLLEGRLEFCLSKNNPGKLEPLESLYQCLGVNEMRPEYLERARGAPALAQVSTLKQTHARINSSRIERRHVRRRLYPGKPGLIKPHLPLVSFHLNDMEIKRRI